MGKGTQSSRARMDMAATQQATLVAAAGNVITAAASGVIGSPLIIGAGAKELEVQATFTYGSGGTKVTAWIQTSLDGGATWFDLICVTFLLASAKKISKVTTTTVVAASYAPTDGTLGDDTIKDGLIGDRVRLKQTSTGTYAGGTSLQIDLVSRG